MQKGIKFRIYPNKGQKAFIRQTLGCCRFIYNRGLAMRKDCLLYTSPSPRDVEEARMPSSA